MSVPAGWYPDPSPGSTLERFWDGESWTEDVRGPAEHASQTSSVQSPAVKQPGSSVSAPQEGEEAAAEDQGRKVRRRTRRPSRPSYGFSASIYLSLVVWICSTAYVLILGEVGWPYDGFSIPVRWGAP